MSRVYIDLAVFDVGQHGARIVGTIEGLDIEGLRSFIGLPLAA